jgi:hypothetical protein
MSQSLYVRDGNGDLKQLEVISGSSAATIVPVHSLTGSIAASLSSADLASLTGSMLAVSGAVGLFNQQLYQALTGGPVSMSVDIVAGDVNAITGSIDKVTAELVKLTVLSGSEGLLVHGNLTASLDNGASAGDPLYVQVVNSASLTASVSVSNPSLTVTASAASPVYVTGSVLSTVTFPTTYVVTSSATLPVFISASNSLPVSGTISIGNTVVSTPVKAVSSTLAANSYATNPSSSNLSANGRLTVIFSNQTNASVLIALTASAASNTNFSYYLMPYETYESAPANAGLPHYFNYTGSATAGYWSLTTTA